MPGEAPLSRLVTEGRAPSKAGPPIQLAQSRPVRRRRKRQAAPPPLPQTIPIAPLEASDPWRWHHPDAVWCAKEMHRVLQKADSGRHATGPPIFRVGCARARACVRGGVLACVLACVRASERVFCAWRRGWWSGGAEALPPLAHPKSKPKPKRAGPPLARRCLFVSPPGPVPRPQQPQHPGVHARGRGGRDHHAGHVLGLRAGAVRGGAAAALDGARAGAPRTVAKPCRGRRPLRPAPPTTDAPPNPHRPACRTRAAHPPRPAPPRPTYPPAAIAGLTHPPRPAPPLQLHGCLQPQARRPGRGEAGRGAAAVRRHAAAVPAPRGGQHAARARAVAGPGAGAVQPHRHPGVALRAAALHGRRKQAGRACVRGPPAPLCPQCSPFPCVSVCEG